MFKKMKLSMKLALGFGLVLVALAIVGSTGFIKITGVQTVVADLSETHVPLLHVVSEIDVSATEQELAATQYALHKDEEFLTKFDEIDKLVDQKFEETKALVTADQDLVDEDFSRNYNKLSNVTDNVGTILETTRSGSGLSFKGAFDVTFGAAFTAIQLVFSTLGLMQDVFINFASDFSIPSEIANIMFIIGFSAIAVTLIFVWLSSISRGKI